MSNRYPNYDVALAEALGQELKRVRERRGLHRADVIRQLEAGIHAQTLATYENGRNSLDLVRLTELCRVLRVSAPELIARVMQLCQRDLDLIGLEVNLARVAEMTDDPSLLKVRQWARELLARERDATVTHIVLAEVKMLAIVCNKDYDEMLNYLIDHCTPDYAGLPAKD